LAEQRRSRVFVAVPVYRGTRFVADTLHSIFAQTHRDLRVMISVDGHDTESADVCSPFLADTRVRMVVQERRLGWVANMNWLIDACDGDFFCYWQQDDLCAPDYLEKLVTAFSQHPDAACSYSDLRWFGRASHEVKMPAMVGFAQQRILAQIEALHWIPLRGLVPTDVLTRVGPIRGIHDSITFSDSLWVLRLAAAGDLIRVPEVLYFKRDHAESVSKGPSAGFQVAPREAWIMLGLMIFSEVAARFEVSDRPKLALVIADRLVTRRSDRWFHYDAAAVSASEPARVAMDFFRTLEAQSGVRPPTIEGDDDSDERLRAVADELTSLGTAARLAADRALAASTRAIDRRSLIRALSASNALIIDCSAGGAAAVVLLEGWSEPEDWGTWNEGRGALLWLPLPGDGRTWQVQLVGQPYLGTDAAPTTPRIIISKDERVVLDCSLTASSAIPAFKVTGDPSARDGAILSIDMPNGTSPASLSLGTDERLLTLALSKIELTIVPIQR
jgi:GT2 family glycosyltransferase